MASANYLDETDYLAEAGQILRGETGKLATEQHLKALQQLVRAGIPYVASHDSWTTDLDTHLKALDWLRESKKCL